MPRNIDQVALLTTAYRHTRGTLALRHLAISHFFTAATRHLTLLPFLVSHIWNMVQTCIRIYSGWYLGLRSLSVSQISLCASHFRNMLATCRRWLFRTTTLKGIKPCQISVALHPNRLALVLCQQYVPVNCKPSKPGMQGSHCSSTVSKPNRLFNSLQSCVMSLSKSESVAGLPREMLHIVKTRLATELGVGYSAQLPEHVLAPQGDGVLIIVHSRLELGGGLPIGESCPTCTPSQLIFGPTSRFD